MKAGILDENPDADIVAEILKDPSITERQKQALIDHYRSYVESNQPPHEKGSSIHDVSDVTQSS